MRSVVDSIEQSQQNREKHRRCCVRFWTWLNETPLRRIEFGALVEKQLDAGDGRNNGIMYIRSTGCQWRYLPKDLPARSTVNAYLRRSDDDRTLNRIHEALRLKCREQAERNAQPTAAIIDSQSVRSVENDEFASICVALMRARGSSARSARLPQPRGLAAAGDHTHGQHPGPRWRRHAHEGAFCCLPHAAHALRRWRISGAWVSREMKRLCPDIDVEIVKRSDLKKFVVVLKRWLVERRMG
jgi:transposase